MGRFCRIFFLVLAVLLNLTIESAHSTAPQTVANSNTDFTADFYTALTSAPKGPSNLIFSPFSVSVVMGMLLAGAGGDTASEITKGMSFPVNDKTTFQGFKDILSTLKSNDNFTLAAANRIYSQTGFTLKADFTMTLKKYFNSQPIQLDFSESSKSAAIINTFVEKITHDKIKNLISPSDLSASTRLVLVNGIYFKGLWKHSFNVTNTFKGLFYTTKGKTTTASFMQLEKVKIPYSIFPALDVSAVAIPYKGDTLSLIVVLPHAIEGLAFLEQKMSQNNIFADIPKLLFSGKMHDVKLTLPKFKLESKVYLKEPLSQIGMDQMFSTTQANFNKIPQTHENLFISKFIQKAFIEVNEEGTEAAAATAAIVAKTAVLQPPIIVFKVDHPFIAFIYDTKTKLVTFVAKKSM